MIVQDTPNELAVLNNVNGVSEFKIKSTAKSFLILSNSLYSNKIRAVIRELSCNAYDSHIAAGKKEVPFTVHLPTVLAPHFSVQDYGIGLSHDEVINLYSTYFESTKNGSNEFIGGLGLGSKSPFAVVNNFTIYAVKDGECGIYSSFVNDHGVPAIAVLDRHTDHTKSNGVKVEFAVPTDKFREYANEATYVYQYFDTIPNFIGNQIKVEHYTTHCLNLSAYVPSNVLKRKTHDYTSHILMGNVSYPITGLSTSKDIEHIKCLNDNLLIKAPIGAVDLQPSREGLQYTEKTIEYIKQTLNDIVCSVAAGFETDLPSNTYDKLTKIAKLSETSTLFLESTNNYIAKNNLFNANNSSLKSTYGNYKWTIPLNISEILQKYNIYLTLVSRTYHGDGVAVSKPITRYNSQTHNYAQAYDIGYSENIVFIKNDIKIGMIKCTQEYVRNTKSLQQALLMSKGDLDKPADFDGFLDFIGNPSNCVLASDIYVRPESKPSVSRNTTVYALTSETTNNRHKWTSLSSFNSLLNAKGKIRYYVNVKNYQINSKYASSSTIIALLRNSLFTAVNNLLNNHSVIGLTAEQIEIVKDNPNFMDFEETIKDYFASMTVSDIKKAIKYFITYRLVNGSTTFVKHDLDNATFQYPNKEFAQYVDLVGSQNSVTHTMSMITTEDLMQTEALYNLYKPANTPKLDLAENLRKALELSRIIQSKYPLIKHLAKTTPSADIINYINLIDGQSN